MRVETERLYLYPISNDEMYSLIAKEADAEMKQAYTEMLERCLMEPDNRIWYAVWNMELKNAPGTIVGDFCFKGLGKNGVVEIGYGLREEFRHQGYMVETVKVNYGMGFIDGRSLCCRSRDRSKKCGIAECFNESRFCEEWSNWRRRSQICLQRKRK